MQCEGCGLAAGNGKGSVPVAWQSRISARGQDREQHLKQHSSVFLQLCSGWRTSALQALRVVGFERDHTHATEHWVARLSRQAWRRWQHAVCTVFAARALVTWVGCCRVRSGMEGDTERECGKLRTVR